MACATFITGHWLGGHPLYLKALLGELMEMAQINYSWLFFSKCMLCIVVGDRVREWLGL